MLAELKENLFFPGSFISKFLFFWSELELRKGLISGFFFSQFTFDLLVFDFGIFNIRKSILGKFRSGLYYNFL